MAESISSAPTLLANQMSMMSNYSSENDMTRILVYCMERDQSFIGKFLQVTGEVVSIEMATYEGAPVLAKFIPTEFSLEQNYPNPFNPITTIAFSLPEATQYSLVIYNVSGRKVAEFSEFHEAGTVEVIWDTPEMASGIYFYRLHAGPSPT